MLVRLITIFAVSMLLIPNASAQKVRRYDQSGTKSGNTSGNSTNTGNTAKRVYYPGEPLPTGNDNANQQQQQQSQQEDDGKTEVTGNYVTVFNQAYQRKRGLALNLPQEKLYRGIIPGTRDDMPHLQRARKKSGNKVTWIGFQPKKDSEGARIFLQTSQRPDYSVSDGDKMVTVTLTDTDIPLRNFSRFIDTSYFKSKVLRIESKEIGRDTVITITLRDSDRPDVDTEGNYVYLDF